MTTTIFAVEPTSQGLWQIVEIRPDRCQVKDVYSSRKLAETCRDLHALGAEIRAENKATN